MKTFIAIFAILILAIALRAYCVTTQAQNLGVISASVKSLTAAQVLASTSTAKGELIYCSDCVTNGGAGTLCVSTGIAQASFVLSTGTFCK